MRVCSSPLMFFTFFGGGPICSLVSRTLGGLAERLNAGKCSPSVRETASSVYHIVEGAGYTEINGGKFHGRKATRFASLHGIRISTLRMRVRQRTCIDLTTSPC